MPRLSVWTIRAALLYLGVGFLFGGLLLYNKGLPFAPIIWRLLPVHVDILLFGWMMQFVMGVAFWIVPRFSTPPRYGKVWLARSAFVLLNGGVLLVIAAQWFGNMPILLIGRIAMFAAALCFALHIAPRVKPILIAAQSEDVP